MLAGHIRPGYLQRLFSVQPLQQSGLSLARLFSTDQQTVGSTQDVPEIKSDTDYQDAVSNTSNGSLAVFQFTASWCGPCKAIKPQIQKFAVEYPQVKFFQLDVDNKDIASTVIDNQISAVPTFVFMKNKEVAAIVNGAQPNSIQDILKKESS
eukprot:TRINITY_DN11623_c0_g1_i1.p1 TRINITY_DN11623_c0_g1~~TRINITY_DN11623_c0_g1_i1.p1  ORF type:complete len:164 (-),score=11.99 TRINITY_DN11623_c0_g1_i1:179-634(-)